MSQLEGIAMIVLAIAIQARYHGQGAVLQLAAIMLAGAMVGRSRSLMNIRHTRQKRAIRKAFSEADRPLSLEEALATAQQHHKGLGIATVYRNIKALIEDRWLTRVEIPGEPPRYETSGKQHHHHFHCNNCGRLYELERCVEQIKTPLPRGFHATGHEFFLYGICASCTPRRNRART
jgi:Fur family transcriptional regulator, ferric uptake regulator